MEKIKIGNKLIGEGNPCFIIAEAGVNHNGSLELAKKLIDAAKEANVDAVKFQTFKSEDLVTQGGEMADYQKKNIGKTESQLAMLKKLELDHKDFIKLKKYCDQKKIIFLSTPHTSDAADFLAPIVPAFKIGSGDLTNLPFLEKIAKKQKPIILSTGMANLEEVREAVVVVKKTGNRKIIILHCTTNYPCPLEEVNLKAIKTLQDEFDFLIGYSDHTLGIVVPVMAAVLGAQVLEKHFTLDKNLPGPDHKASLTPKELKEMVKVIRDAEEALGSAVKKSTKSEEEIKKISRKSIVAKFDIPKNSSITKDDLIIKRPGTGIEPKYFKKVIGRRTKKDIKRDELIKWEIIE